MSILNRMVTYVKNAWGKEPVIVSSIVIGLVAMALPWMGPYTSYSAFMNDHMSYHYTVPVRDDGNMPDIPVHTGAREVDQLKWRKK